MATLPFEAFQQLDLPLAEVVAGPGEFVHDLFSVFPYELRETLPDDDRDLVVLLGSQDRGARIERIAAHPGRVIVVFGPQDFPIGDECEPGGRSLPENVVALYGTNVELADRRALALPLGVRESKLRQLKFVRRNHSGGRDGLLYGNFAITSVRRGKQGLVGPRHRADLAERLRDVPWVTLDAFSGQRRGPEQLVDYYSQIASHRFTLSPEGFGVDTYRTWESLYLGSIPIVTTSTAMSAFADLPILFVDDYDELSEAYLERCWESMSRRSYDLSRLMKSHYLRHFLGAVSALEDPRFVCWRSKGFPTDRFVRALEHSPHPPSRLPPEPPAPPFSGRRRLMRADTWHAPGGLSLEQRSEGMELTICGAAPRLVEFPLETIAGARFRLTGKVGPGRGAAAKLTVAVSDGSEEIGMVEIDGAGETALSLDFRARSDRTVLSISAGDGAPEAGLLLRDFSLEAEV